MVDYLSPPFTFVFTRDAVRRSMAALQANPNHEHVPGYLAIMRAKADGNGLPGRSSDITEVYDRYLRVADAPEKFPYVRVFKSRGTGVKLSNENVAGSYAISNRRAGGPFFEVVDVTGDRRDTEYNLPTDHAAKALKHLLKGFKLPITALTAFMYRDYGFRLEVPTVPAAVQIFRREFGLGDQWKSEKQAFETLFVDDSEQFTNSDIVQYQGLFNG